MHFFYRFQCNKSSEYVGRIYEIQRFSNDTIRSDFFLCDEIRGVDV